ncbi:MAG TPA: cobyrinate a,c-diamide synthase, partial [Dissulfurispiraceae bacterium]|nr:cobyrinate a,c-diamide synthase [Dissulfurispiraceae bacterium]
MSSYPRIIIAGMRGGSGKTTVSLAMIAGCRAMHLSVAPFKKGPDYIDAGWLSAAAGTACHSLDPFLIPAETIQRSFVHHHNADIAIIEGNRGLHDGKDEFGTCSTAEVAKLLNCPVMLVVDCTKMTRTAAALVLGCMKLDEAVRIRGAILNHVSGKRHASIVRASIERYCGIPVLGVIPRLKTSDMPERHMGLIPYQEHGAVQEAIAVASSIAHDYLDMEQICSIARSAEPLPIAPFPPPRVTQGAEAVSIGVLRDAAFQFYYPENLEALQALGAKIVEIDALSSPGLPPIDALYIGGGFPETNAIALAANISFRDSVKVAVEQGLPVYAECGGLMFLGESIIVKGARHPMTGIFPLTFEMHERPQAHGYSIALVDQANPYYPQGTVLNGHEFHYSSPVLTAAPERAIFAFRMRRGEGIFEGRDGLCYKNVLATYTHVHALGTPLWAEG